MCVCNPSLRTPWCGKCHLARTSPMPKCKPAKVSTDDLMEELTKRVKVQVKEAYLTMSSVEFVEWLGE